MEEIGRKRKKFLPKGSNSKLITHHRLNSQISQTMDTIGHALWSLIVFRKIRPLPFVIIFGALPDFISWGPLAAYNFLTSNSIHSAAGEGYFIAAKLPLWGSVLYGLSHSLIIFGIVALAIYIVFKKIPTYLFAWPLHIFIDLPMHASDYLPTPFLWPFSSLAFPGAKWWEFGFYYYLINYGLIAVLLAYFYFVKKEFAIKELYTLPTKKNHGTGKRI